MLPQSDADSQLQLLYRKWRAQRKAINKMDIFDPAIESELQAANKTLIQLLKRPVMSRVDAYTVLYIVMLCGTHERAFRRALLNVLRFIHVMSVVLFTTSS